MSKALEFFGENVLIECFSSDRLDVHRIDIYDSDLIGWVLTLLSVNVTMHLPDDWQNIDNLHKAKNWLEQRLMEGDVFSIYLAGHDEFVGLLFLYKFENDSGMHEVRIGYLISEKFWGRGLGSELVSSLLLELSKVRELSQLSVA